MGGRVRRKNAHYMLLWTEGYARTEVAVPLIGRV